MYKVQPFSLQFETPAGLFSNIYPMKSLHHQEVHDDIETTVKKQEQLIDRIEKFLEKMVTVATKSGLPEEISDRIMINPVREVGRSINKPVRSYTGRYEIVCLVNGMIPFSLIALPDWIPGGISSNFQILLYGHSSLLLSNSSSSKRFEHALKVLKEKVPLCYPSKTSKLSLTIRVIIKDESPEKNELTAQPTFYVHDFDNKQVSLTMSKCLLSELALLRCVVRILGLDLAEEDVDEILSFSKAANNLLKANSRISKHPTSAAALAIAQSLLSS